MRKLIRYLKPYWIFVLLAPIFMVGEVYMDLLQPVYMSKIVNEGVLGNDFELILRTGLIMLALIAVGGLFGVGSNAFGSVASQSFGNDLRKDCFKKVMSLSIEQSDKFTTGSLITRLTNDVTAVQDFVATMIVMLIRVPMQFIGGIIMILSLGNSFGTVLVITLPFQILTVVLLIKKAGPLYEKVQKKLDKVNAVVQENIAGARVVKAYTREDHEIGRFDRANSELTGETLKVQKITATLNPVLMLIMNAAVIAIIYIGGLQVEAKNMQVGDVMAAITYVTQILMSVMMLSMMFQSITRAMASAKRINEVLETEPVIKDGKYEESKGGGNIEFKNVTFSYPDSSGRPVLKNIDLNIKKGETVAILGATGQGKTTLVSLIPRFYDVTEGEILLDGVNIKEYKIENLRSKIGFILQKSEFFSGTIKENIKWGNKNAGDTDVKEAAVTAQAHDFIMSFQNGYDTVIGEKGASLSGGQKQRLAIARGILKKPDILIFDDSTSALDTNTEAKLQEALREQLTDTTVIMIAQRVACVRRADRIILLDDGKICAEGTHAELLEKSGVYKDIYESQMKNGGEENA